MIARVPSSSSLAVNVFVIVGLSNREEWKEERKEGAPDSVTSRIAYTEEVCMDEMMRALSRVSFSPPWFRLLCCLLLECFVS